MLSFLKGLLVESHLSDRCLQETSSTNWLQAYFLFRWFYFAME